MYSSILIAHMGNLPHVNMAHPIIWWWSYICCLIDVQRCQCCQLAYLRIRCGPWNTLSMLLWCSLQRNIQTCFSTLAMATYSKVKPCKKQYAYVIANAIQCSYMLLIWLALWETICWTNLVSFCGCIGKVPLTFPVSGETQGDNVLP
jgi:hypothetical protein